MHIIFHHVFTVTCKHLFGNALRMLCIFFRYESWSYISSPGWVQIKCELRILSQFAFTLRSDYELPVRKESNLPLKEGVRDMLVKHHLFSWDI